MSGDEHQKAYGIMLSPCCSVFARYLIHTSQKWEHLELRVKSGMPCFCSVVWVFCTNIKFAETFVWDYIASGSLPELD